MFGINIEAGKKVKEKRTLVAISTEEMIASESVPPVGY
jgi:hypothetical protein